MEESLNEIFVGEFTEKEKNDAAKKILKRQNDVRHKAVMSLVTTVIASAVSIAAAVIAVINFKEIAESEMESYEKYASSGVKVVDSASDVDGPAGIAVDILYILLAPFTVMFVAETMQQYKRNTAIVSSYKVYKCIFVSSFENPCIKGLYNTKIQLGDRVVEFDTRCDSITELRPGDEITVIDFIAVKGKEPEKTYDYNSFEQGFRNAFGKGRANASESDNSESEKYIIV